MHCNRACIDPIASSIRHHRMSTFSMPPTDIDLLHARLPPLMRSHYTSLVSSFYVHPFSGWKRPSKCHSQTNLFFFVLYARMTFDWIPDLSNYPSDTAPRQFSFRSGRSLDLASLHDDFLPSSIAFCGVDLLWVRAHLPTLTQPHWTSLISLFLVYPYRRGTLPPRHSCQCCLVWCPP